ncbi:unnamed protein product [Soboliphyme baturini]|uniref:D-aminoacyl-tRNA deacylase n=1 Tax=Soboliphyme baturini TaxID=241478 RepID=A0A183IZQ3_9BILA|nr:unnamed protein product [Soboliphyme baturini]
MRIVVQRVHGAFVKVGEEIISRIGRGLCVLVGIFRDDTEEDLNRMIRKILNIRLFSEISEKRWCKSVSDLRLEVLCISQFTLCATVKKNRPDYHLAMEPVKAHEFYQKFLDELRNQHGQDLVKDGKFGEHMDVHLENDGPVTIVLESRKDELSSVSQTTC